jgi:hypothetical protein
MRSKVSPIAFHDGFLCLNIFPRHLQELSCILNKGTKKGEYRKNLHPLPPFLTEIYPSIDSVNVK